MYQRVGHAAYKADLSNTISLCEALGDPQNNFKSIHIAGTNGKGSVAHMLSSILQSAGLKVGLHTSPHYKDFRERIKINGEMIPEKEVVSFVEKYRSDFEKIQPSFFEMSVGMAFEHFSNEKVDVAVIETGMGGRLDSTNVIVPVLSIITNIGLDHTQYLGATYQEIAREKAGIIKEGVPVLIGEKQVEMEAIFRDISQSKNSPICFADSNQKIVESDISGPFQKKNINTVIKAVELLTEEFKIDDSHIKKGLGNTMSSTGFMGRWQLLGSSPKIICDAGHNIEGTAIVQNELKTINCEKKHFVLGFVSDKDIGSVLELYPKDAIYYFCKANIPRGLEANELLTVAKLHGLEGIVYSSVSDAFLAAKQNATQSDLIFVGGSTFVVAEII